MTENDSRAGHFHQRTPRRVVKTWNSKEDVGLGYGAIRAHDISNKPSQPLTTRPGVGYEENVVREPRDCSSRNILAQTVINHESQSTQHKQILRIPALHQPRQYLQCVKDLLVFFRSDGLSFSVPDNDESPDVQLRRAVSSGRSSSIAALYSSRNEGSG